MLCVFLYYSSPGRTRLRRALRADIKAYACNTLIELRSLRSKGETSELGEEKLWREREGEKSDLERFSVVFFFLEIGLFQPHQRKLETLIRRS